MIEKVRTMMVEVSEITVVVGVENEAEKSEVKENFAVIAEGADGEGEFLQVVNEYYLENNIINEYEFEILSKGTKFVEHLETVEGIRSFNVVLTNDESYVGRMKEGE